MTEPTNAYIACTDTPERVLENGFVHVSHRATMFLNPSEALLAERKFIGLKAEEHIPIYLYHVDLTQLEGVWPRVNWATYNDNQLQWTCSYQGKIPVAALSHVTSSITKLDPSSSAPENAKTPPTTKADGE